MTAVKKRTGTNSANTKSEAHSAATASSENALTVDERMKLGKEARATTPREALAELRLAPDRPDPVDILEKQAESRLKQFIPIRYGRMQASPFAHFRGGAAIMATDLKDSARSGLQVQLCGDAHLSNFGFFASPERALVFDVNDFDETLPGPWEFDLKRLATSFVIAARHAGHRESEARGTASTAVVSYQKEMARLAALPEINIRYTRVDESDLMRWAAKHGAETEKRLRYGAKVAKSRTSQQAAAKLTTIVNGEPRFVASSTLFRLNDEEADVAHEGFLQFRDAMSDDRRWLFNRYRFVDVARKVVGVGSVGTRDFVVLLRGRDESDHLVLQIKQAERSVIELAGGKTDYPNQGQRVVNGQRLIQSSSDIFLSWGRSVLGDDFYLRQLRDWKFSVAVEALPVDLLQAYAQFTGRVLAMAHARSGDAVAIASYIGKGGALVDAIGKFAVDYADQNARDYEVMVKAIISGKITAQIGV